MILLLIHVALAAVPTKMPPDKEKGETLYRDNCWSCHGQDALGDGPVAAALSVSPPALAGQISEEEYDQAIEIILHGQGDMPAYSEIFDRPNARRILVWLADLDPVTGQDPDEEDNESDSQPTEDAE